MVFEEVANGFSDRVGVVGVDCVGAEVVVESATDIFSFVHGRFDVAHRLHGRGIFVGVGVGDA